MKEKSVRDNYVIRKVFVKTKRCFSGEYKGHKIDISRDAENDDWYIIVECIKTGTYGYDGWWRNSEFENIDAAIEEALKGSKLIS